MTDMSGSFHIIDFIHIKNTAHVFILFILLKLNNVTVASNTCDSYYWDNTLYVEYRNVYITNLTVYKN